MRVFQSYRQCRQLKTKRGPAHRWPPRKHPSSQLISPIRQTMSVPPIRVFRPPFSSSADFIFFIPHRSPTAKTRLSTRACGFSRSAIANEPKQTKLTNSKPYAVCAAVSDIAISTRAKKPFLTEKLMLARVWTAPHSGIRANQVATIGSVSDFEHRKHLVVFG